MNIQKIDTRWFQDRLADRQVSQRKLASMLNLDPAAVSLMVRGKRKMSAAEAAEVARVLNVSVDEVLARAGIYAAADSVRAQAAMAQHEISLARKSAAEPLNGAAAAGVAEKRVSGRIEGAATALNGSDTVDVPVPMADGAVAVLRLPRTMRKDDAQRISAVVAALAMP